MTIVTLPASSGVTLTPKGERYLLDNPLPPLGRPGAPPAEPSTAPSARKRRRPAPRPHPVAEITAMIERLLAWQERAAGLIADLIGELDALEPDPDLEPSLAVGHRSDEFDREVDDSENEPDLGWTAGLNQASPKWLGRSSLPWSVPDGEAEHDGREPDDDAEPAGDELEPPLGALEPVLGVILVDGNMTWPGQHQVRDSNVSQANWARGGDRELEVGA